MDSHVLNLYEIENLRELETSYRLVEIEGPFGLNAGDGDLADRNVNLLAKRVAYEERAPVAVLHRGEAALLAVPADLELTKLEYALTPDVISLRSHNETYPLSFRTLTPETETIGLAFLQFHLRAPLRKKSGLWSSGPSFYFSKRPVNYRHDGRDVDVYGGFGFRKSAFG